MCRDLETLRAWDKWETRLTAEAKLLVFGCRGFKGRIDDAFGSGFCDVTCNGW